MLLFNHWKHVHRLPVFTYYQIALIYVHVLQCGIFVKKHWYGTICLARALHCTNPIKLRQCLVRFPVSLAFGSSKWVREPD